MVNARASRSAPVLRRFSLPGQNLGPLRRASLNRLTYIQFENRIKKQSDVKLDKGTIDQLNCGMLGYIQLARACCKSSADFQSAVSQASSLQPIVRQKARILRRMFSSVRVFCRLEIGDTAGWKRWKPALPLLQQPLANPHPPRNPKNKKPCSGEPEQGFKVQCPER
jgi:hypothetical protein